tara:strand:+ start:2573 stop:5224 length:2652 start_codon:yes stop_codon:yes gene_type:complete
MTEKFLQKLDINNHQYNIYSLDTFEKNSSFSKYFPFSYRVLLENLIRTSISEEHLFEKAKLLYSNLKSKNNVGEIDFFPSRVLMQDFTGVPALADLASMRERAREKNIKASRINPLKPVDLVIDHSVMVDKYASSDALKINTDFEFERNHERYKFLKWGQKNLKNFRVIPPGIGICHQVNMEFLAKVVWYDKKENLLFPDSLVGTDSHTTMINGLSVLGWGVGGIEAEAVMLGEAVAMTIPKVVGVNLKGKLNENSTPTDLVLTITNILRSHGVVNKFVEFYGPGLSSLSLADRATISNMAPEYGATCGFFPIDQKTIKYLRDTGRNENHCSLVEIYAKEQRLWVENTNGSNTSDFLYNENITIDISTIEPVLAGPKRPQDKVKLSEVHSKSLNEINIISDKSKSIKKNNIKNGDVVLAAITSCTNTANPYLMISAGLLAKKAYAVGLRKKSWVKTSLAPGSQVVTDYLKELGLLTFLEKLGFNIVGYGCTTCIGNSGPLNKAIEQEIIDKNLNVSSVLSGNRNFEGRVHPYIKSNWLASPPLVVAYSLFGTTINDITKSSFGVDKDGKEVFLKDLWPNSNLVNSFLEKIEASLYLKRYKNVGEGNARWDRIDAIESSTYDWDISSSYVQNPPFLSDESLTKNNLDNIKGARILAILGDSITTDHISPAGSIKEDSPAGNYLKEKQIAKNEFNSYGARRGSHDVMIRGTFANIRLKNKITPKEEGGYTKLYPENKIATIYKAADEYKRRNVPLVVFAGKEYGTGSSRDWAAKGTRLLGVKAVIVESFERIHRSNLIGMGVLPIQFTDGLSIEKLNLSGSELVDVSLDIKNITNKKSVEISVYNSTGDKLIRSFEGVLRIDTDKEFNYIQKGNILNYVLDELSE